MNGKSAIYGLFDTTSGKCLYVGRTNKPHDRMKNHRSGRHTGGLKRFAFRVFKWVARPRASFEESKAIYRYKRRGEAVFNRMPKTLSKPCDIHQLAMRIKSMRRGHRFDVPTVKARSIAIQVGAVLRATDSLNCQIITKANGNGGFTIYAV